MTGSGCAGRPLSQALLGSAARVRRRPVLRRRVLRQLRHVRQFTRADFEFFRSARSDDYGLLVNLVGLFGYWGERIGRFPAGDRRPRVVAAHYGRHRGRRDPRRVAQPRSGVAARSAALIGLLPQRQHRSPRRRARRVWLVARVPLVAAFREPRSGVRSGSWPSSPSRPVPSRHSRPRAPVRLRSPDTLGSQRPPGAARDRRSCPRRHLAGPLAPDDREALPYPDYWYATAAFLERNVARGRAHRRPALAPLPALYASTRDGWRQSRAVFFPGRLMAPHNLEIPGRETEIASRYDRIGFVVSRGPWRSAARSGA